MTGPLSGSVSGLEIQHSNSRGARWLMMVSDGPRISPRKCLVRQPRFHAVRFCGKSFLGLLTIKKIIEIRHGNSLPIGKRERVWSLSQDKCLLKLSPDAPP